MKRGLAPDALYGVLSHSSSGFMLRCNLSYAVATIPEGQVAIVASVQKPEIKAAFEASFLMVIQSHCNRNFCSLLRLRHRVSRRVFGDLSG
jgi:hypothetical protein